MIKWNQIILFVVFLATVVNFDNLSSDIFGCTVIKHSSTISIAEIVIPKDGAIKKFFVDNEVLKNDLNEVARKIVEEIKKLNGNQLKNAISVWKSALEFGDPETKALARLVLAMLVYDLPYLVIEEPLLVDLIEVMIENDELKIDQFCKGLKNCIAHDEMHYFLKYLVSRINQGSVLQKKY